ncbi:DNA helicase [Paenibacillus jamilae]|uniref:DNA helicase n=1 Tax=Paenibacillus jamilae TaxID=114136 RepID=A0ACC4ZZQ4_9BACL|nr:DnaB-like helicase C-terminal domain-containing protein [Paenibacillus jamilae]KTS84427.1 DNA helicase [Paenibacillus jamilae]
MIEAQLLSKVIDENKFYELARYNIGAADFPTYAPVYEFIEGYVQESRGDVPDYRTVAAKFPDFDYMPEVTDGFRYLASRAKDATAKRKAFELLQHEAPKKFKELGGAKFSAWLFEQTERIKRQAELQTDLGVNYATNGEQRKEWYRDSKEKRSFSYIPAPYASLTKALGGGFERGDGTLLMAYTNRGKSWIATDIGRTAWRAGFGVLHYSPELSQRQQSFRIDTIDGQFNNVNLRRGQLENEEDYFSYLDDFTPDKGHAPYIVKTMEDLPNGLSLDVIEADLQMFEGIAMVIIDGFNLMDHGRGGRDAMTQTSRKMRQLWGRHMVAGIVVHQTPTAAERDKGANDDGERLVSPPKLTDYSETVAVIQDNANVLTFDQAQGIGRISIEKAREPSVGQVIELVCNFNLGVIQEPDVTSNF